MQRTASAAWSGAIKTGRGTISTGSGVLRDTPYSFITRFEGAPGTNPEELLGASHAGCFTMAVAAALTAAGKPPEKLETTATVTLENVPERSWTVTKIHLALSASVPGIDDAAFQTIAAGAKKNCPISRVLNAEITLEAKLA
jgi:osmotically inducible protein OsmC